MTQRGREHTVDVPETRGSVVRRREKATAIGAEGDVLDQRTVPVEDRNLRAALDVPDTGNTVHRRGGEKFVVRAERAVDIEILIGNPAALTLRAPVSWPRYADQLTCPCIPKTGGSVDGNDCYKAAVVTEGPLTAVGSVIR